MDVVGVAGLIVAVVSAVTAISPLLTRGALRWKLRHDTAVLKDLPDGLLKEKMAALVQLEISQLTTDQELHVVNEQRRQGSALMFLGSGLWVLPYLVSLPNILSLAVPTMAVIWFVFGAVQTILAIVMMRPPRPSRPPRNPSS